MIKLRNWFVTSLVVTAIAIAGGATRAAEQSAFRTMAGTTFDRVAIREDVNFSSYDTLLLTPVSVWYPKASVPSSEAATAARENLNHLQARFIDMMQHELADHFAFSETPGPGVLQIDVQFIDLRSLTPEDEVPAEFSRYPFRTMGGHVTLVGALRDSETGTELARAADMSPRQSYGDGVRVDWEVVDADLERWVSVFAEWLLKASGHLDNAE